MNYISLINLPLFWTSSSIQINNFRLRLPPQPIISINFIYERFIVVIVLFMMLSKLQKYIIFIFSTFNKKAFIK